MNEYFILLLSLLLLFPSNFASENEENDNLYILLDSSKIFKCRGVKKYEIELKVKDIGIRDEDGKEAHYVKAPGNYSLHFKRIRVLKKLGNLIGELSATLQVPLFEGPAGIRFDFPFQAIPESSNLVTRKCDEESGVIQRGNTPYCRYCNLCVTANRIDSSLQRKSIVDRKEDVSLRDVCGKVNEDTYEIKKTIRLPGRKELEKEANNTKVDSNLKSRLQKGQGRLVVFLNLLNTYDSPPTQDDFFKGKPECRCCSPKNERETACKLLRFLYCHMEECKSKHASECVPYDTTVAACYTVQFFYRVTTDFQDVREFLRSKGLPDEEDPARKLPKQSKLPPNFLRPWGSISNFGAHTNFGATRVVDTITPSTPIPIRTTTTTPTNTFIPSTTGNTSVRKTDLKSSSAVITDTIKKKCVEAIDYAVIKRLCKLIWKDKYCCSHCANVCK